MTRWPIVLSLGGLAALACAKIPTRENSRTPPESDRDAAFQPDPEPWDASSGEPFGDGGGERFDAGCPAAMPEAGAECFEWEGAFDCVYPDDAASASCTCRSIPEAAFWVCARDE